MLQDHSCGRFAERKALTKSGSISPSDWPRKNTKGRNRWAHNRLNEQVHRNADRFRGDLLVMLINQDVAPLRSQFAILERGKASSGSIHRSYSRSSTRKQWAECCHRPGRVSLRSWPPSCRY